MVDIVDVFFYVKKILFVLQSLKVSLSKVQDLFFFFALFNIDHRHSPVEPVASDAALTFKFIPEMRSLKNPSDICSVVWNVAQIFVLCEKMSCVNLCLSPVVLVVVPPPVEYQSWTEETKTTGISCHLCDNCLTF